MSSMLKSDGCYHYIGGAIWWTLRGKDRCGELLPLPFFFNWRYILLHSVDGGWFRVWSGGLFALRCNSRTDRWHSTEHREPDACRHAEVVSWRRQPWVPWRLWRNTGILPLIVMVVIIMWWRWCPAVIDVMVVVIVITMILLNCSRDFVILIILIV